MISASQNTNKMKLRIICLFQIMIFDELSPDDFKISSYNPESPLTPISQNFNFDIDETIARADLDPALSNESIGTTHKNRINLIFRENKQHAIRNSYQLAACLAAIVNTSWINT